MKVIPNNDDKGGMDIEPETEFERRLLQQMFYSGTKRNVVIKADMNNRLQRVRVFTTEQKEPTLKVGPLPTQEIKPLEEPPVEKDTEPKKCPFGFKFGIDFDVYESCSKCPTDTATACNMTRLNNEN